MFQSVRAILLTWQVLLRLLIAFFVPYILFSGIMTVAAEQINASLGGKNAPVRIGVVRSNEIPVELLKELKENGTLIEIEAEALVLNALDDDSLDIGLVFPTSFYEDSLYNGTIKAYYNALQNGGNAQIIFDVLRSYEDKMVARKFEEIGLDKTILNPIAMESTNTFNPILFLGKIMDQVKEALSNVLNLLFILLVLWLARNLVLRAAFVAPDRFWTNLVLVFLGTLLGMFLVFIGFQSGINTEQEGMIRSVILSIQQLFVWVKLSSIFLLWIPVWLLIIGLLGCLITFSKRMIDAYSSTFWMVVFLHLVGFLGVVPITKLSTGDTYLPLWNIFRVGQSAMKGDLNTTTWYVALGVTTMMALVVIGIWYRQYHKIHLK